MSPKLPVLKAAIVGHTNTGKTSLVRTLTRDAEFGEVSDRPATTRHVEGTVLLINGRPLVELYDTPGLEDPIGLLELLDRMRGNRRHDWIDVVREFLDGPAAHGDYAGSKGDPAGAGERCRALRDRRARPRARQAPR